MDSGRELYFLINFVIMLLINVPGNVDCKSEKFNRIVRLIRNSAVTNNLRPVADQMSQMARVFNGITLGQSLLDGSADMDKILEELMNVGPVVRLSELENGGLDKLDEDLGEMEKAVKKPCGAEECVNLTTINQGVKLFEQFDFLPVERAFNDEVLNEVAALARFFHVFYNFRSSSERIIKLLNDSKTISAAEFEKYYKERLDVFLFPIPKDLMLSFEKAKNIAESKKEHGRIVDILTTILALKDVNDTMHAFSSFKTENQRLSKIFSSVFSKPSFKYFESFNVMGELAPREGLPYNKQFAKGFPNGPKDIDLLKMDLAADLVKAVLEGGGNMREVEVRFLPVMGLRKKVTNVLDAWDSMKIPKAIRTPIQRVKAVLKGVIEETDQMTIEHTVLEPFQKCIRSVKSGNFYGWKIKDLEAYREKFKNIDSKKVELAPVFQSKLPFGLKENLSKIRDVLEGDSTEQMLADLKDLKDMDDIIVKLQTLQKTAEEIYKSSLRKEVDGFELFIESTENWFKKFGIKTALKCIQNITEVPKNISFPQSSIFKLKENEDIDTIRAFSRSLKHPIEEIRKWKDANHTFKSKDSKPFWKLSDPWKTTVHFANAAEQISDLARIYEEREAVKQLVMASDKIDEQARNLNDKEQKEVVKRKWDMLTKDLLRVTYNQLEELNEKMPEIRNFSDFLTALDVVDTFFYPYTDVSDLQETLKFVKEPAGIQEAIAKVSKLNLNFISYRFKVIYAKEAIPEILESLNPSEPTTTTTTRQPTFQDDYVDDSNWKVNVGIGVFLAILGLVLCYLMVEVMSGFAKGREHVE